MILPLFQGCRRSVLVWDPSITLMIVSFLLEGDEHDRRSTLGAALREAYGGKQGRPGLRALWLTAVRDPWPTSAHDPDQISRAP